MSFFAGPHLCVQRTVLCRIRLRIVDNAPEEAVVHKAIVVVRAIPCVVVQVRMYPEPRTGAFLADFNRRIVPGLYDAIAANTAIDSNGIRKPSLVSTFAQAMRLA